MILRYMKIWIRLLIFSQLLYAQDLSKEKYGMEKDSLIKAIPGLDSVLYSIAGLDGNEIKNKMTKDSIIVAVKKNAKKNEDVLQTDENLFVLFEKDEITREALLLVYAEWFIAKNATVLVMERIRKKKFWKIKVMLSYIDGSSVVDEVTFLCMEKHKLRLCSEKE